MKRRQFFERTAAGQGNSTIVMANNAPGLVIVTRDEECLGMDPQLFATTPPKGYTDATPPATKKSSRIGAALKL